MGLSVQHVCKNGNIVKACHDFVRWMVTMETVKMYIVGMSLFLGTFFIFILETLLNILIPMRNSLEGGAWGPYLLHCLKCSIFYDVFKAI